jgi:signal transduction histidine kinase
MSLQGTVRLVERDPVAAVTRIEDAVDGLDITVKQIRTAIFGLEQSRPAHDGLRSRILALAREAGQSLEFEPRVLLDGPIDTGLDDRLGAELLSTLREALSNVARHAQAQGVDVEVVVDDDVCLRVVDDGIGPPSDDAPRGNGLANMATRATQLGGGLVVRRGEAGGTLLEWRVPRSA